MNIVNGIKNKVPFVNHLCRHNQENSFDLLVEYEEKLLNGKNPDPRKYLERCPDSERGQMVFALNLATLNMRENDQRDKEWEKWLHSGNVEIAKNSCIEKIKAEFLNSTK